MANHSGQCMCGAVGFTVRELGQTYGACHCGMCRRWTGSAFLGISVPEADIDWQGEEHIKTYQSSEWAERAWCAKCGSHLWYRVTAEGPHKGGYELPIGLLDDANGLRMTHEIFFDLKPDAFAYAGEREHLSQAQVMAKYGITDEGAKP